MTTTNDNFPMSAPLLHTLQSLIPEALIGIEATYWVISDMVVSTCSVEGNRLTRPNSAFRRHHARPPAFEKIGVIRSFTKTRYYFRDESFYQDATIGNRHGNA